MGLGGINSWGAEPLNAYRLTTMQEYKHKFRLSPIRKQLNDPTPLANLGFKNLETSLVDAKYPGDDIYKNDLDYDPTDIKPVDTKDSTKTAPTDSTSKKTDKKADKKTDALLPGATPSFAEDRSYGVFDMQGRLVARFKTHGIEDLQVKTFDAVKRSGLYIVKSNAGGQSFRIKVHKQ